MIQLRPNRRMNTPYRPIRLRTKRKPQHPKVISMMRQRTINRKLRSLQTTHSTIVTIRTMSQITSIRVISRSSTTISHNRLTHRQPLFMPIHVRMMRQTLRRTTSTLRRRQQITLLSRRIQVQARPTTSIINMLKRSITNRRQRIQVTLNRRLHNITTITTNLSSNITTMTLSRPINNRHNISIRTRKTTTIKRRFNKVTKRTMRILMSNLRQRQQH